MADGPQIAVVSPTVDDLRDLARHSRRTLATGFLALVATLLAFPALAVVWAMRPRAFTLASYAATIVAGGLLVLFMHAAGRERGAFRRVFRLAREDAKTRRSEEA